MLCWSNPNLSQFQSKRWTLIDLLRMSFSSSSSSSSRHRYWIWCVYCVIEAGGFRNNNGFVKLSATQIWEIHSLHFICIIDINAATIYRQWNYESYSHTIPEDHHSSTLTYAYTQIFQINHKWAGAARRTRKTPEFEALHFS